MEASGAIDAAMYRLTNPQLACALEQAHRRGLRVRLLTDQGKFEEAPETRDLLADTPVPYRTLTGRRGKGSKLHHKFAILDNSVVLAGSYNWTMESEKDNYDFLLILGDPQLALAYQREFDRLWTSAPQAFPA